MDDRTGNSSEMTFAKVDQHFDGIGAAAIGRALAMASDVVLLIDRDGKICDASFKSPNIFSAGGRGWVGRKILELVTTESEGKVAELLEEARKGNSLKPREINHTMVDGDDAPISYEGVNLDDDHVLLFGSDISRIASLQRRLMSSQLSMEREVARLRNNENQYRAVFQLSKSPQLVVDAESLKIVDANAAAGRLLSVSPQKLVGKKVLTVFGSADEAVIHKFFLSAIATSEASETEMEMETGEVLNVGVSHFPQDGKSLLVVHFQAEEGATPELSDRIERKVLGLIRQMPDAFVVTDADRNVLTANPSFCDMVNVPNVSQVEGMKFDTFFERPNVDCNVLLANVREHNVVRRFATSIKTHFGQPVNVEIAACQFEFDDVTVMGFALRPTNNLVMGSEIEHENISRSNEQIANLVGHMSLRDIVKETTEMIEQLCIETALELTQNNRASAAQMLGVSRQSLYSKLGKDRKKDED